MDKLDGARAVYDTARPMADQALNSLPSQSNADLNHFSILPPKIEPKEIATELQRTTPNNALLNSYLSKISEIPPSQAELDPWQGLLKDPGGKMLTQFVLEVASTLLTAHGNNPVYLNFAAMVLHLSNFKLNSNHTRHLLGVLETADINELPLYRQLKVHYSLERFGVRRPDLQKQLKEAAVLINSPEIVQGARARRWLDNLIKSIRINDSQPKFRERLSIVNEPLKQIDSLVERVRAGKQFGRKDFHKLAIPCLAVFDKLSQEARAACSSAVEIYSDRFHSMSDESFNALMGACKSGHVFHPAIGDEAARRLSIVLESPNPHSSVLRIHNLMSFIGNHPILSDSVLAILNHNWVGRNFSEKIQGLILCGRLYCSVYESGQSTSKFAMQAFENLQRIGQAIINDDSEHLRDLSSSTAYQVANSLQIAQIPIPVSMIRGLVLNSNFSLRTTRDEGRIQRILAKYSDISELVSNGRFEEVPWIHPDVCVILKDGRRFAFECDGPVHFYWDLKQEKELHLGKDLVSASVLKRIGINVVRLDFRDFNLGDDNDLEHFVAYSLNLPYRAAA